MHELGIISNLFSIIEEVAEKNSLAKITSVTLKLGKLQQIVPEMLTFAFETVAQGTKAEDASLYVEYIPIKMRCNSCEEIFVLEEHIYICPKCAHTGLTMLEGQEIFLESLEGEQA
jgi:hydrogenase nickel incorporation protein HypA/HybF